MKSLIALLTAFVLTNTSPSIAASKGTKTLSTTTITICTPEWDGYTQQNGKGLYHDLWRMVYQPKNINIEVRYTPFIRCESLFKTKKYHEFDVYTAGYAGVFKDIPNAAIIPYSRFRSF